MIFRIGGDDADRLQRTIEVTNAKDLATQADYEFMLHYKAGAKIVTRRGRSVLAPFIQQGQESKIVNWTNANHTRSILEIIKSTKDSAKARTMAERRIGLPMVERFRRKAVG